MAERSEDDVSPDDLVLQAIPLGAQWPTLDPFLFCAHHHDDYPAGNGDLGPTVPLTGRQLGQDFDGIDGWNMYHGLVVPGFPQHPHRGFETITYVRSGMLDHSDSLGATARFGRGDVQWMTAGSGIVHAEMFPLLDPDSPNPLELFQIWLNLPAVDKLVDPYFTMFWDEDIPTVGVGGDDGESVDVTVIAGRLGDSRAPTPPPNSWASQEQSDLAIWHLSMPAGGSWQMPAASGPDTVRTIYVFSGDGLQIGGRTVASDIGVVVRADREIPLAAPTGAEVLVLQGRPIDEPVARYGPFVMTTQAEIEETFRDYQRTGFGGWPWGRDDPVHERGQGRFARHVDGRVEERS
jgi:redox-sensitive bicupin YhaK (pirin superfamily)